MSDWTPDTAERFTQLRLQEMSGRLSSIEQALVRLRADVAREEQAVTALAVYQETEKGLGSAIIELFSEVGGVDLEILPRSTVRVLRSTLK